MPEPGDLVTSTRVFGIDSVIQQLGALTAALDNLRREVLDRMTSAEEQFTTQADRMVAAISNVSADLQGLKDELASLNTDIQGQGDAGVQARMPLVVDVCRSVDRQIRRTPGRPRLVHRGLVRAFGVLGRGVRFRHRRSAARPAADSCGRS